MITILEKAKSDDSKVLLDKLNNDIITNFELSEDELNKKYDQSQVNYFDIGNQLINYEECKVRYLYDNNANIYFRAKDICTILGYADTSKSLRDHVKEINRVYYSNIKSLTPSLVKGNEIEKKNTIYINETGLYCLMLSSQQKQAIKFKDWICESVLPSIRKHGFYKLHHTFNLKEYDNKNCLYIFKGDKAFYKIGITKEIIRRMSGHKSDGLMKDENQICDIFVVDTYLHLMEIERKIKEYLKVEGFQYEYKNYTELFKEEYYDKVIGKVKELLASNNLKNNINIELVTSQTSLEILKLQNENLKLENENLKLKEESKNIKKENTLLEIETNNKINELRKEIELLKQKPTIKITNNIKKQINTNLCIDCKTKISNKSNRCNNCENKKRFLTGKGKRPPYDQLLKDKEELKSNVQIAKKYNVSDVAVRKWFLTYAKYNKK